jgi:hypothetical protein
MNCASRSPRSPATKRVRSVAGGVGRHLRRIGARRRPARSRTQGRSWRNLGARRLLRLTLRRLTRSILRLVPRSATRAARGLSASLQAPPEMIARRTILHRQSVIAPQHVPPEGRVTWNSILDTVLGGGSSFVTLSAGNRFSLVCYLRERTTDSAQCPHPDGRILPIVARGKLAQSQPFAGKAISAIPAAPLRPYRQKPSKARAQDAWRRTRHCQLYVN